MNFANRMQIIQKLIQNEQLVAAYNAATNMPLIDCSSETFNDRAFAFENEELMKTFIRPWMEKKMPLKGIIFPKKDRMRFFSTLLSINVDELVYVDKMGMYTIRLGDIIKRQDVSKIPPQARPVENPQLQMSGIYFVQEAARGVSADQKTGLKDLEEEFSANVVKGVYLIPAIVQQDPPEAGAPGAGNSLDSSGINRPVGVSDTDSAGINERGSVSGTDSAGIIGPGSVGNSGPSGISGQGGAGFTGSDGPGRAGSIDPSGSVSESPTQAGPENPGSSGNMEISPTAGAPGTNAGKQLKFNIPLIKDPKGNVYQPIFTDNIELAKYAGKNPLRALKVPFKGLEQLLAKEAAGYMLNPAGFHLVITRTQLAGLKERFPDTPEQ